MSTVASFLAPLLIDAEVAGLIGTEADIAAMLWYELALAQATADAGLIAEEAARAIATAGSTFRADLNDLSGSTLRDGVVVPGLIKQLRAHVGAPHGACVHFGATSQDVIDTALALKLRGGFELFEARLARILARLEQLIDTYGQGSLMGRTRMQAAIPITVADRLDVWRGLLARARADMTGVAERNLILSLAGAAGTGEKFGSQIDAVRSGLAGRLDLAVPAYVPHAARDRIAALGDWLCQVTGGLGKIGQDVTLMAQNDIAEIVLSGGGSSSAMAHKHNPVAAELLIAFARFNAVQVSGLHHAVVQPPGRWNG